MSKHKKPNSQRRVIILCVADTHAGNKLGLMNPAVELLEQDESGEFAPVRPPLGPLQKRLWKWFTKDVEAVAGLAGEDEIIYLHQGDVVQGHKHMSLQVGNGSQSNQLLIAIANQIPILGLPNIRQARFIAGTAAHDGIGAAAVVSLLQVLKMQYPAIRFKALYHGVLNVDGFTLDYAHHGPAGGSRKWLEGNSLLWYLRDIVLKEWTERCQVAARVHTRAHVHVFRQATYHATLKGEQHQFDAILLPSWCGMGDFAYKVTRSEPVQTFGMIALEVVGGELVKVHQFIHSLDLRVKEDL